MTDIFYYSLSFHKYSVVTEFLQDACVINSTILQVLELCVYIFIYTQELSYKQTFQICVTVICLKRSCLHTRVSNRLSILIGSFITSPHCLLWQSFNKLCVYANSSNELNFQLLVYYYKMLRGLSGEYSMPMQLWPSCEVVVVETWRSMKYNCGTLQ